jgi:hypothetical protein
LDYYNLHLEAIEIPADAETRAKEGKREWQYKAADGLLLEVQYAKNGKPAFCGWAGDDTDGLKYVLIVNHINKALTPLTKALKKLDKDSWQDYIVGEIDKNPVLAASQTAYAYESSMELYVWTTDKNEFSLLLTECSKAIVNLAPNPVKKFDTVAAKALTNEKGLAAFAELIRENADSMSRYQNLNTNVVAVFEKHPPEKLLPLIASLACVDGFAASLSELTIKHKIDRYFQTHAKDYEELFLLLQESVNTAYTNGKRGLANKEYICGYIRLLANAFTTLDYGVYPNGIETVIRLFENDSVEGISVEAYQTVKDYNATDYAWFDGIDNEEYYKKLWAEIDVAKEAASNKQP